LEVTAGHEDPKTGKKCNSSNLIPVTPQTLHSHSIDGVTLFKYYYYSHHHHHHFWQATGVHGGPNATHKPND